MKQRLVSAAAALVIVVSDEVNLLMLRELSAVYKGLVQRVFMVTDQNVGATGEDRKRRRTVLWKMRKLKDRRGR